MALQGLAILQIFPMLNQSAACIVIYTVFMDKIGLSLTINIKTHVIFSQQVCSVEAEEDRLLNICDGSKV